jgi:Zn finger protein HypA/HybF involved in hydrogenase expression
VTKTNYRNVILNILHTIDNVQNRTGMTKANSSCFLLSDAHFVCEQSHMQTYTSPFSCKLCGQDNITVLVGQNMKFEPVHGTPKARRRTEINVTV